MNQVAVTTTPEFQTRMFEKIRDQLGDLLTDEDLKRIVEAAVQKGFFEPSVTTDRWGNRTTSDAQFVVLVRGQIEEQVRKAAHAWVQANADKFDAIIKDQLERGFTRVVANYFDTQMNGALYTFAEQFKQAMGVRP